MTLGIKITTLPSQRSLEFKFLSIFTLQSTTEMFVTEKATKEVEVRPITVRYAFGPFGATSTSSQASSKALKYTLKKLESAKTIVATNFLDGTLHH